MRRVRDDVPVTTTPAKPGASASARSGANSGDGARPDLLDALRHAALATAGSMARTAALAYSIVLFIWAATGRSTGGADVANASHAAFTVWLATYGAFTSFGGLTLSVLPLGLVALGMWSTYRASRRAIRDLVSMQPGAIVVFALGVVAAQSAVTFIAASWAGSHLHTVRPLQACAASAACAAAMMWLLMGNQDIADALYIDWRRRPTAIALATVRKFAYVYLAVSSLAYFSLWVVSTAQARAVTAPVVTDLMSQIALAVVNIVFMPVAILWVSLGLAGGPVVLGSHHISLFAGAHASWPPLASFAVLPVSLPAYAPALMLVPIAAAAFAAFNCVADDDELSWWQMIKCAMTTAFCAGLAALGIAYATSGAITGTAGGHWNHLGPRLIGAGYLAGEVFIGVLIALWLALREPMPKAKVTSTHRDDDE